ncbi:Hypothetical predicted protein, partial [Paramuricea clavata]
SQKQVAMFHLFSYPHINSHDELFPTIKPMSSTSKTFVLASPSRCRPKIGCVQNFFMSLEDGVNDTKPSLETDFLWVYAPGTHPEIIATLVADGGHINEGRTPAALNSGPEEVLVVPNKETLKRIPPAQGLLAFSQKNQQLLVKGEQGWSKIAMEKKAQSEHKLILRELNAKQKASANQLSGKQQVLEQNQQNMEKQIKSKLKNLEKQIQALNKQLTKKFMDSQILRGKANFIRQLSQWVPIATSWSLCYRATRNGWSSYTFHSKCDYKGATVTIIRVGSYIFGGFSDASWGASSGYRS